MEEIGQSTHELGLLAEIERDPDVTQATMATKLGVAVGTVNWYLKRLVAKGYVKVKRAERRKLRYILTPEGIALRARLTVAYVERSMALYRQAREDSRRLLAAARERGYRTIRIEGDGDIADVCKLTCLEVGMPLAGAAERHAPRLVVDGQTIVLKDPEAG